MLCVYLYLYKFISSGQLCICVYCVDSRHQSDTDISNKMQRRWAHYDYTLIDTAGERAKKNLSANWFAVGRSEMPLSAHIYYNRSIHTTNFPDHSRQSFGTMFNGIWAGMAFPINYFLWQKCVRFSFPGASTFVEYSSRQWQRRDTRNILEVSVCLRGCVCGGGFKLFPCKNHSVLSRCMSETVDSKYIHIYYVSSGKNQTSID